MSPSVAVRVIPAAGAGRRMGATKALLDFDGASALNLLMRLRLGDRIGRNLVVVGHDAERVSVEAEELGVEAVVNENWERGQTGSLQAGLERALEFDPDWIVIHPVDLPLVAQSTYDACHAALGDAEITVPSFDMRRGHPLIVKKKVALEILALSDDRPVREVVRSRGADIRHVEVDDPWVIHDLDRPSDYAAALEFFRAR